MRYLNLKMKMENWKQRIEVHVGEGRSGGRNCSVNSERAVLPKEGPACNSIVIHFVSGLLIRAYKRIILPTPLQLEQAREEKGHRNQGRRLASYCSPPASPPTPISPPAIAGARAAAGGRPLAMALQGKKLINNPDGTRPPIPLRFPPISGGFCSILGFNRPRWPRRGFGSVPLLQMW